MKTVHLPNHIVKEIHSGGINWWMLLLPQTLRIMYRVLRGRRGRDRIVVGFTTTYAISANLPLRLWVRIPLMRDVLDTTLCDKVYQWLATSRWFSPGTPVSSTNKTDHYDITEVVLKVALNTINLNIKI